MKRVTAFLLAAVLACGGFGSLAASADETAEAETTEAVSADESSDGSTLPEGAAARSSDQMVTLDSGETIVCPDGWDAEDPEWVDAYLQLNDMLEQEEQDSSSLMVQTFATYQKTTWAKNGGGTLTFYHASKNYSGNEIVPVIDVSKYQPSINWTKVKAAGIDYAIIRVGYRSVGDGSLNEDAYYQKHIEDALAAGIKVGVYIYSQAITKAEAVAEANYVLERISDYDIALPVIMDYEYYTSSSGRLYTAGLSKSKKTQIAKAFMQTVEDAGYDAMLYAGSSFLRSSMNGANFSKSYPVWCARYYSYLYAASSSLSTSSLYQGDVEMWQCTSSASVAGISGNVDFSYWYKDPNWTSGNTGQTFTARKPTVSIGTVTKSSVTIKWSAVKGASQYRVFYSDAELGTYSTVTLDADQTSYTIEGLNSGQEYYFRVRAINSSGSKSKKSAVSSAVTSGGEKLTVQTTKAIWLRAQAGSTSGVTKLFKVPKGTVRSVTAVTKGAGGKVWYKVKYKGVSGYVSSSAVKLTVRAATNLKQAGRSLQALKISWTKSPDATSYKILRSASVNGKYEVIATVDSSVNTYRDTGLSAGTIYYYKVRAVKTGSGKTYTNTSAKISAKTKNKTTIKAKAKAGAVIRKNAGTSCKKLVTVPKGTVFKVTHKTYDKNGKKWYYVTYKSSGKTYKGYIRASDLKKV